MTVLKYLYYRRATILVADPSEVQGMHAIPGPKSFISISFFKVGTLFPRVWFQRLGNPGSATSFEINCKETAMKRVAVKRSLHNKTLRTRLNSFVTY